MTPFPRGVSAAMITLYTATGDVDGDAMGRLGRWLMSQGCESLLVFGTTGEGPSISVSEKIATIRAMIDAGIPAHALIVGAGSPALRDVVSLVNALGELGCHALVIPPYFFRAAPREGVQAFMNEVLTRTSKVGTGVFLYHFTEMSTVAVDSKMMAALLREHPDRMRGVKDSSGDINSLASWLQFPELAVFAGDDHLLRPLLAKGGAGVMTATAGLAPALVKSVLVAAKSDPDRAPLNEARLNMLWRDVLLAAPVTEAVKLVFADVVGDSRWLMVRPPLRPLDGDLAGLTMERFRAVDEGIVSGPLRTMPRIFA
ncbi:MAG: dihydrodipicolinate synthase family protein [Rhodospirillaceae bacterium]